MDGLWIAPAGAKMQEHAHFCSFLPLTNYLWNLQYVPWAVVKEQVLIKYSFILKELELPKGLQREELEMVLYSTCDKTYRVVVCGYCPATKNWLMTPVPIHKDALLLYPESVAFYFVKWQCLLKL